MKIKLKSLMIDIISALFIILFTYAALTKFIDNQKFRVELGKSPILNTIAGFVAISIPTIELILAILLAIQRFQYYVLYISFSLMVAFSTYIIAILKFGSYIPCSCGGILQNMTWSQHLIFNILFIVMGAWAILLYPVNDQDLIRDKKGSLRP